LLHSSTCLVIFPEVNRNGRFISTVYPGNTAEDVEKLITDPVEEDKLENS
jgi:multidrug efflux pump subunit AcrB